MLASDPFLRSSLVWIFSLCLSLQFSLVVIPKAFPAEASVEKTGIKDPKGFLKGHVTATPSPFLTGSVQNIPKGTEVELILMGNLNSEINQKGDEIWARVAIDVKNGSSVLLPGGWFMHGQITDCANQRRLGRDGYLGVDFDTLISPDGSYELPFAAKFSTRDHELKAITKTLVTDAGIITEGAAAGAILSTQLTGIGLAIASHGYSVAIGAGIGAGIGAIGALKRKGKIASFYPGDAVKLKISDPLSLPGFDPTAIPSAAPKRKIKDLDILITKARFSKDPYGDKQSRLLTLDLQVNNNTKKEYSFFDMAIVSDHNQRYYPSLFADLNLWKKKMAPNSCQQATISFNVDGPKQKYWLVLLDRTNRQELTSVPVN